MIHLIANRIKEGVKAHITIETVPDGVRVTLQAVGEKPSFSPIGFEGPIKDVEKAIEKHLSESQPKAEEVQVNDNDEMAAKVSELMAKLKGMK